VKHWLPGWIALLLCLLLSAGTLRAASTLDVNYIDNLFTSDTNAFRSYISSLEQQKANLSLDDQQQLNYYRSLAAMTASDYRSAQAILQEVLADSADPRLRYRALVSLINVYQLTGNFYQAFVHGLQLSEEPVSDIPAVDQALAAVVMALTLMDSGLYEEAAELIRQKQLWHSEPRFRCSALYLASQIAYKSGIFVRNMQELESERQWCSQQQQHLYGHLTDTSLAIMYLEQGQAQQALALLASRRAEVERFGYNILTLFWDAIQIRAQAVLGSTVLPADFATILTQLEQRLLDPSVQQSMDGMILAYQALMLGYKALQQPERALHFSELYISHYQKHHNRQLTAALAYHAALMQAAQRRREIEGLNLATGRLQLEAALSRAEVENNQLYLAFASLLLLLVSLWLLRIYRAKARLRERVTFDKLTRVFSRDHFENVLETALQQAEQSAEEVGFILFDLDHFKQINDRHGHQVGDWVLQHTAATVRGCLRSADAFGRLGGEEFAILLRHCNLEQTLALAETIRQAVETIDTSGSGKNFRVTASFGVAIASKANYHSRTLVANADEHMYQAKRAGRNAVRPELDFRLPADQLG